MPILKENKHLYPENWKELSNYIRFERAKGKCENCGAIHKSWVNRYTRELCLSDEENAIRIILTTAHLDHNPQNNKFSNLKALCQKCHNNYDKQHRSETRKFRKNIDNLQQTLNL